MPKRRVEEEERANLLEKLPELGIIRYSAISPVDQNTSGGFVRIQPWIDQSDRFRAALEVLAQRAVQIVLP
jgi:hypothetical protein